MTNVQLIDGSATIYGTYDGQAQRPWLCFPNVTQQVREVRRYFALSLELFGKVIKIA